MGDLLLSRQVVGDSTGSRRHSESMNWQPVSTVGTEFWHRMGSHYDYESGLLGLRSDSGSDIAGYR